jgi:exosome complex component RRP45
MSIISNNEEKFILDCSNEEIRIDGREIYDYRNINIKFGKNYGQVEVRLGKTKVLSNVSCEIVEPYKGKPTDGFILFNVDLSPMGGSEFENNTQTVESIEISRIIDRSLRGSKAIDTEALCIVNGKKVWSLRIDLQVIDNDGNILDAAHIVK